MAGITKSLQVAASLAATDLSTLWSYLKHVILIPRQILLHGLAFNPIGDSFHFTFEVPYSSTAYFVKARFYELHSEWGQFNHVKDIGDIEIWRVPRIKGAEIPNLDGELQKIFMTRTASTGRYVEAFAELVLQGVRMKDSEIVEEEQEGVVEFMFVVPGSKRPHPFPRWPRYFNLEWMWGLVGVCPELIPERI